MQRKGFLIVVSGPSGAGKNSLINAVLAAMPELRYSVSATTRVPRPGEREGEHYFFRTQEQFRAMIADQELLEWAEYCGNCYGTPRRFIADCIANGQVVIMDIDTQGAAQIRKQLPEAVLVFLTPPSFAVLEQRLLRRDRSSVNDARERLKRARTEMKEIKHYHYCVINDSLEQAAAALIAVVKAEQLRLERLHWQAMIAEWENGIEFKG